MIFSQRRKNKADGSVGLSSVISSRKAAKNIHDSLAPPQLQDGAGDDNGDINATPTATPKRANKAPKSPQPRRKSYSDQGDRPHAPGHIPGRIAAKNNRSSLAPGHKQNTKMDVARAMGIMGFNSSRWLECSQVSHFKNSRNTYDI